MSAAVDAPPAPRTRTPVKKTRKILSCIKLTEYTEVLNKPPRHEEHKERYFKIFVNFVPLWRKRSFKFKGNLK